MTRPACSRRVLSYGGGLDSWGVLCRSIELGCPPDACVFCDVADPDGADPGEWPGTYQHIADYAIPLCEDQGIEFVWLTSDMVDVRGERSLWQWMSARHCLPGSGGKRLCTRVSKVERYDRYVAQRWPGEQVETWIGFDAHETNRAAGGDPYSTVAGTQRVNRFPLMEWGWCRCRLEAYARQLPAPVPRKSACLFCAMGSRRDWKRFAEEFPADFEAMCVLEDEKPLTGNGRKFLLKGQGKLRVDGTRKETPLREWVKEPGGKPRGVTCNACGGRRATKDTGCDYLPESEMRDDYTFELHQLGLAA